jgi:RNA polymerase sigma-70 factor (ECF subfamily)
MQPLPAREFRSYAPVVGQQASLGELDDATLAQRIISAAPERDAAAESELCRRFAPRIRLYGRRHLRSDAAAADLVQDVLILTLQKLRAGAVREPERLASFILGTCRQTVIDGKRGVMRRELLLDTFSLDLSTAVEDAAEPIDTQRLQKCLERLRPADAVGRELGITAANVRVIRHRGIERLRQYLRAGNALS